MSIKNLHIKNWRSPAVWAPTLFFLAYFLLGLGLYDDYGMSWDEELQREHGKVSAQYVNTIFNFTDEPLDWRELRSYKYRYHGVWFSLTNLWLENIYDLKSYRHRFMLRHKMVFFMFFLGSIFLFLIAKRRFKDWKWALLPVILLLACPRIFADSFYNPKDMVFLPLFVISTYTMILVLQERRFSHLLLHAISCAFLISTRIIGVIIPTITIFMFLVHVFNYRATLDKKGVYLSRLLIYLPLTALFTYALYPYLWEQPFHRFAEIFTLMAKFEWSGDVFFQGQFIKGTDLPWYYAPYWMLISLPPIYFLFFIAGLLIIIRQIIGQLPSFKLYKDDTEEMDLIFLGLFIGPVLAVIVQRSVIYDGWRHLYFVTPAFVLICSIAAKYGIDQLKKGEWKYQFVGIQGIRVLLVLSVLSSIIFMLRNHPHQNTYFNFLAGDQIEKRFDVDYWGVSFKQGLEKVLEIDSRDSIRVAYASYPAELNHKYLHSNLSKRLILEKDLKNADYFLSNFRQGTYGKAKYNEGAFPYENEIHAIQIGNAKILGIYRLDKDD